MKRLLPLTAFALFLVPAAPANATPAGIEHVARYNVTMTVEKGGAMRVREAITYDFGSTPKHGIFRDLVQREVYTADTKYDRVYRISDVHVSDQVKVSTQGRYLHLRIGDPDQTVTGTHDYTFDYTVRGAPIAQPDHDELYWDAIGLQWGVPIDSANVRVVMPAGVTRIACFSGGQGSHLGCDRMSHRGDAATFAVEDLDSFAGVTVVVAIPKGSIEPPPAPILEKRWNVDDAFARRPDTVGLGGGLALLGVGGAAALAWRRGRDRRFTGGAVDQAMGNLSGEEERMPVLRARAGPVEFVPPDGIRPGQVGVLVDENANLLDVTATIIDLAVRGYLTITELPPEGLFHRRHDYELARVDPEPADRTELLPYERTVLSSLFTTSDAVKLSDLKYKFRADLLAIRNAMYDDAVKQGWYRMRPDRTRAAWHALGIAVVVVGGVLVFVAARWSSYGLVPIGVVIAGLALLAVAHHMPARTGKGSGMLSRVRGFRRLFDEGDEDIRARFAEQHDIFSQYLPYAIVFGCATKWAHAFEGLDSEALGTTGWYSGHDGAFDALVIAHAMDDFGTVATGTMYASQPSSSGGSGFGGSSGGGGGGGGGGSW